MARRWMHIIVVLALAAGLWMDLGLVVNRSLYGLLLNDPWYSVQAQRDRVRSPDGAATSGSPTLMFFGDSTCDCVKSGDAADRAVPTLGLLMERDLAPPHGLFPKGWRVSRDCASGNNGYSFESVADSLALSKDPPKAAIIVVNLRSLNRLGFNGFPDNGGSAPALLKTSEFLAKSGVRSGVLEHARDAVRFSLPAAVLRSLTAWSREGLVDCITPRPLPDPDAPSRPEAMVGSNFRRVYGEGYELNEKTLEALISAGALLQGVGCRTLYYLTPVDRRAVAREVGPGALRQLDAAAAKAAEDLRQAGYPVLDLHALLDGGFIDAPSEHLAAAGRRAVARRLSDWVYMQLFPRTVRTTVDGKGPAGSPAR